MDLAALGFGASSSKDVKGLLPCDTSGGKNAFTVPHATLDVIPSSFSPLAELRVASRWKAVSASPSSHSTKFFCITCCCDNYSVNLLLNFMHDVDLYPAAFFLLSTKAIDRFGNVSLCAVSCKCKLFWFWNYPALIKLLWLFRWIITKQTDHFRKRKNSRVKTSPEASPAACSNFQWSIETAYNMEDWYFLQALEASHELHSRGENVTLTGSWYKYRVTVGQHWTILQLFVLLLGFIGGLDAHLMWAVKIVCLVDLNVGGRTKEEGFWCLPTNWKCIKNWSLEKRHVLKKKGCKMLIKALVMNVVSWLTRNILFKLLLLVCWMECISASFETWKRKKINLLSANSTSLICCVLLDLVLNGIEGLYTMHKQTV